METNLMNLDIAKAVSFKSNPRGELKAAGLAELIASIKARGIIEPLVGRCIDGKVEIVCGSRRLAAANLLEMKKIPVVVYDKLTDAEAAEMQIIENLQRKDLNPLEEAKGFEKMLKDFKYDFASLASKVGKSEYYIRLRVQLLGLPDKVQNGISNNTISPGHGAVIMRIGDKIEQLEFYEAIVSQNMSIKEAESNLSQAGLELQNAPIDTGACEKCEFNGAKQKDLFNKSLSLKGRCLNRPCLLKKNAEYIAARIEELKKEKIPVVAFEELSEKESTNNTEQFNNARLYLNSDDKEKFVKIYKEKCLKCPDRCFVKTISSDYGEKGIQMLQEICTNKKCLNILIRSSKTGENVDEASSQDRTKRIAANRLNETQRRFWIKNLIEKAFTTPLLFKSILVRELLSIIPGEKAKNILKIKSCASFHFLAYAHSIYDTGNDKVDKALMFACGVVVERLTDKELKELSDRVKIDIKKEFTIDEEYLNTKTKDQLLKLAKEIGLNTFLQKKDKKIDMEAEKKSGMIDLFLKRGFALKGVVPKELRR